jgi:hypothetical protein
MFWIVPRVDLRRQYSCWCKDIGGGVNFFADIHCWLALLYLSEVLLAFWEEGDRNRMTWVNSS